MSQPSSPPLANLTFRRGHPRHSTKALGYFETNAVRMRYAHFRELGHFVGSGAVEAGG